MNIDTVIIGAGITGMTCAYELCRNGRNVHILERQDRIGGQIRTFRHGDFIFESGPNTGVLKYPEIVELFEHLGDSCQLETALESSKRRLIWKKDRFHELPSGLASAIRTPLFSWYDKFRILGEPWRRKGDNPNESVGSLAERRLGKSFVQYAVDPFLSGVYAGDPYSLPVRLALPRLYQLEQNYGSFVKGSIALAKKKKSDREKLATKQVFSAKGGFSNLIKALSNAVGNDNITTGAESIKINPNGVKWDITYSCQGTERHIVANNVVTTCGSYSLPDMLPFVDNDIKQKLGNLYYAPVVQIGVGIRDCKGNQWKAFGGLVPSCENKQILGILFPSACFQHRSPEHGSAMAYFIGGVRHQEMLDMSDEQLKEIVNDTLSEMLDYPEGFKTDEIMIFRHPQAIPQYQESSDDRFNAIETLQKQYPTLRIAGNLRDGIGIGDRIKQAIDEALFIMRNA